MKFNKTYMAMVLSLPLLSGCKSPWGSSNKGAQPTKSVKKAAKMTQLNSAKEFEASVLKAKKPTVVKFTAPWCGACKKVQPIYEKVAKELNKQYNFVTINVDNAKDVAKEHGIKGIPTFLFFKDGKKVKKSIVGSNISRDDFVAFVKDAFK